jgi:hypothetical protein
VRQTDAEAARLNTRSAYTSKRASLEAAKVVHPCGRRGYGGGTSGTLGETTGTRQAPIASLVTEVRVKEVTTQGVEWKS